jgi:L-aminopeptidase/D-esterase-like protein
MYGAEMAKVRARDLGIPFDGIAGEFNVITDVRGAEVGYSTIVVGDDRLKGGEGPARTGVTAILPRRDDSIGFGEGMFATRKTWISNGPLPGNSQARFRPSRRRVSFTERV